MRKRFACFIFCAALAGFCCCASGCVSLFANGIMMERMDPPTLYAGVQGLVQECTEDVTEPRPGLIVARSLLLILDMPLEAAMDTLLLPWVIVGTIEHNQRLKALNGAEANSNVENNASERQPSTIRKNEARDVQEFKEK